MPSNAQAISLCVFSSFATYAILRVLRRSEPSSSSSSSSSSPSAKSVKSLIENRRSVFPKQYNGDIIPKATMKDILDMARWAPNHKLNEPWKFIVFSGSGKKKLGQFLADDYKATAGDSFNQGKYTKKLKNSEVTSHIVALICKSSNKTVELEDIASTSMAVQNIHLYCTAVGVGMYWSSGSVYASGKKNDRAVTNSESVREFLEIEEEEFLIGWGYFGLVEGGEVEGKGVRKEMEETGRIRWVE